MSKDFAHWSSPRTIDLPDESDDMNVGFLGNNADIDQVCVIKRGNVFFGFLGIMANLGHAQRVTQLMWSRDGLRWKRLPDRPLFIENGASGEWDYGQVGVHAVVPAEERVVIYYSGSTLPQKERRLEPQFSNGMAYIENDRFIGQQAGIEGGYLLTRQFLLEGNRLALNCRSPVERPPAGWKGGLIRVELLRAPQSHLPAHPLPGFTMDDCDPITVTDDPHRIVTWHGSADLSKLRGQNVYLRFYLKNATLYTFQLEL
jgi:hypothetical protein